MAQASDIDSILIVGGTVHLRTLVERASVARHCIERVSGATEALERVRRPGVRIACLALPFDDGVAGSEVLRALRDDPDLAIVVAGVDDSLRGAASAYDAGATWYVRDPAGEPEALVAAIEQGAARGHATRPPPSGGDAAEAAAGDRAARHGLLGESTPMRRGRKRLERVAEHVVPGRGPPVLLCGETGTGKELAARTIHGLSARAHGPFVHWNCASTQPQLAESLLFGHVRGAFTGARESHAGVFRQAHRGVLFLDDLDALPTDVQPKLLSALETGRVRPVGGERDVAVDVQIITATNRDLRALVEQGAFERTSITACAPSS